MIDQLLWWYSRPSFSSVGEGSWLILKVIPFAGHLDHSLSCCLKDLEPAIIHLFRVPWTSPHLSWITATSIQTCLGWQALKNPSLNCMSYNHHPKNSTKFVWEVVYRRCVDFLTFHLPLNLLHLEVHPKSLTEAIPSMAMKDFLISSPSGPWPALILLTSTIKAFQRVCHLLSKTLPVLDFCSGFLGLL